MDPRYSSATRERDDRQQRTSLETTWFTHNRAITVLNLASALTPLDYALHVDSIFLNLKSILGYSRVSVELLQELGNLIDEQFSLEDVLGCRSLREASTHCRGLDRLSYDRHV